MFIAAQNNLMSDNTHFRLQEYNIVLQNKKYPMWHDIAN